MDTMSLKEVIRWSNTREREVLMADKRRKVWWPGFCACMAGHASVIALHAPILDVDVQQLVASPCGMQQARHVQVCPFAAVT